ncbi:TMhelix containing protein [Vibrio phage 1.083.O._10N.286.52.B9]|nr:TMhelix containing protein [Vibrio phage 1.083.O._10N.286.52.B9]AUS02254.1 TMhelix containing protein [Vibrio phage 2.096.O._10N.286.48.B5]
MNTKSMLTVIKASIPMIPMVKQFIFSDGKFNIKRSVVLFAFLIAIGVMTYAIGIDNTTEVIDLLDDVSDVIGYDD